MCHHIGIEMHNPYLHLLSAATHGLLSLFNSSRSVSARAIYLATCFVTFNTSSTHCQMLSQQRGKKKQHKQHMISKFVPKDPLCATMQHLRYAVRLVCSNGFHMWKPASLRSVFNLTQFQSMFSNRWASLRDYTWPPGQPGPLPQKEQHSKSCWVICAIQTRHCRPPTLCTLVDNEKITIETIQIMRKNHNWLLSEATKFFLETLSSVLTLVFGNTLENELKIHPYGIFKEISNTWNIMTLPREVKLQLNWAADSITNTGGRMRPWNKKAYFFFPLPLPSTYLFPHI